MQHRNNLSFEPCCSEFLECLYLTLPRSPSLFGCTPDLRYIHFKKDTSLPVSPPQEEVSQVFFKHKCCVMCVGQLPGQVCILLCRCLQGKQWFSSSGTSNETFSWVLLTNDSLAQSVYDIRVSSHDRPLHPALICYTMLHLSSSFYTAEASKLNAALSRILVDLCFVGAQIIFPEGILQ